MKRGSNVAAATWRVFSHGSGRTCAAGRGVRPVVGLAVMAFAAALTPAVPRGAARTPGYSYAGVASAGAVGGVAATLELSGAARIRDGQVAAWVGVGGPGLGRGGVDEWIQG